MNKKGRPALEDNEIAVRINVSLPLSLAQEFRRRVPMNERSALVARLLQEHLEQDEQDQEDSDTTKGS